MKRQVVELIRAANDCNLLENILEATESSRVLLNYTSIYGSLFNSKFSQRKESLL